MVSQNVQGSWRNQEKNIVTTAIPHMRAFLSLFRHPGPKCNCLERLKIQKFTLLPKYVLGIRVGPETKGKAPPTIILCLRPCTCPLDDAPFACVSCCLPSRDGEQAHSQVIH